MCGCEESGVWYGWDGYLWKRCMAVTCVVGDCRIG